MCPGVRAAREGAIGARAAACECCHAVLRSTVADAIARAGGDWAGRGYADAVAMAIAMTARFPVLRGAACGYQIDGDHVRLDGIVSEALMLL